MRIATLLVTAVSAALLQSPQPARIASLGGEAEIVRSAVTAPARVGDLFDVGDRLHTRASSSVVLSTSSGVTLQLNSETRLELKKADGESIAFLTDGSLKVKSAGKPVRIETKYGLIIGTDESLEFEVRYDGDGLQVLIVHGFVRAEVPDASKVAFRNAADSGTRVYEAGSISPKSPRSPRQTRVIVYPEVGDTRRGQQPPVRVTPPVLPK